MADRVIIVGASRRGERIPIGSLRQMCGRAGRGHELGECHADLIVAESDADYVENGLNLASELSISSVLSKKNLLAFHILPEIASEEVLDVVSAELWHERSFHSYLGFEVKWEKIFEFLSEHGCVIWDGNFVKITPLGSITASYYFHSSDVCDWKNNFSFIFELGLENDDLALAWALGNVRNNRRSGDCSKLGEIIEDCRNRLPVPLEIDDGCVLTVLLWWHVFGGPPVGKLKNQSIELKSDFGRIYKVLSAIDSDVSNWGMQSFFDDLLLRSKKAISSELVKLIKIGGITKGQAIALKDRGISNRKELLESKEHMDLTDVLGEGYDFS
jgi:hypothetical protein